MPRAVVDTNVLVSALIRPSGPAGQILDRLADGAFEMVLSRDLVAELRRSVRYPRVWKYIRLSDDEIEVRLAQLETLADPVAGTVVLRAPLRDSQDVMVLAAAVEGRADCVVTGDQDLLALGRYEGIAIVTPREFLELLGE